MDAKRETSKEVQESEIQWYDWMQSMRQHELRTFVNMLNMEQFIKRQASK